MRIRNDQSAAVVVDIQERLFPHIHEHEQLAANVVRLIQGLHILDIPMWVTQQYTKGLGPTIAPVREVLGEAPVLEKMTFSCCGAPGLMEALQESGRQNIILFGIEAHACVLQTAIDLLEAGYHPVVVEDCISSRRPNDKQVAVARMRQEGATITTYESLLLELCVEAGTERFKSISKIIK